jgi:uncharacterized protein (DUF302 family)
MEKGVVTLGSRYSVKETLDRLEQLLQAKGATIFARIDQMAEAEKAGLKMKPLELLLFGNPKAGTPLMIAEPLMGIDLPLKAIAWEDAGKQVWLSYNSFYYLQERFGVSDELMGPLLAVEALLKAAVL